MLFHEKSLIWSLIVSLRIELETEIIEKVCVQPIYFFPLNL